MQESSELPDVLRQLYEALSSDDATALERMISRQAGTTTIGTDQDEWWSGYDAINQGFRARLEELGRELPIVAGEIQAFQAGNVGWVADRPTFQGADGTELPFRLTAIFHREDEQWKVVLSHVSFGVKNEPAAEQESEE